MLQKIKRFRIAIAYTLLLLLAAGSLNGTRKLERDLWWYDRFALFLTSPIQSGITYSLRWMNSLIQNYLFLIQTKQENRFLLVENRRLFSEIATLKEFEIENKRLRELLEFEKSFPFKQLTAQVIGRDSHPDFRSIRINKGSEDGVKAGMPVVTHEGIVGRVLRTSGEASDVLTILDNQSAVDALIQRSRTRGIVEGISDSHCQMKYTLRTDQVEIGDHIISSGLGGVFPKGISLGFATRIEKKSYGVSQTIELKPSVDFSKLEEVIVLLNIQKTDLKELTFNDSLKVQ